MSHPALEMPTVPRVWCVEIMPDDDYDSSFDLAGVFTDEAAATEFAAQVLAPGEARVYSMPLLGASPRLITNYRHMVSVRANEESASLFANHSTGYRYDPATAHADMSQFTAADMSDRQTHDPCIVTVHPVSPNGLILIEVYGTDKAAVDAAFVKTYLDAERNGVPA